MILKHVEEEINATVNLCISVFISPMTICNLKGYKGIGRDVWDTIARSKHYLGL